MSFHFLTHHYLTFAVVCTVGSCTVTIPSALVFPTIRGLLFRMSGAVVAVTRCCSPPALLARFVSRKEYWVSGSKPVISFLVCLPSTSTDWPFPYRIWEHNSDYAWCFHRPENSYFSPKIWTETLNVSPKWTTAKSTTPGSRSKVQSLHWAKWAGD